MARAFESRDSGHRALPILTALLLGASPMLAQTPAQSDSILARLERAEEQIALLRQQLATQAQSQVQAKSRVQVELWGRVLANGWWNSGAVNNLDVPTVAIIQTGEKNPTAGGVFRQTMLGLDVSGVRALGADLGMGISMDLFGGVQTGAGNRRLFPEPRLRIARATMRWPAAELMLGQDVPLITPEEPVSLASLGTPNFALAGNLWFWLPQLRLALETPTRIRFGIEGAVVAPWSGDDPAATGNIDMGESSGRPSFQARVRTRWGEGDGAGEVGIGAHVGWLRRRAQTVAVATVVEQGHALAATARIPLGWLELRGEIYQGQLLRGLGGGGIGQNFGAVPPGLPAGILGNTIHDRGGWGQVNLRAGSMFLIGGGCGVDDPYDRSNPARSRNQACEGHLQFRPASMLILGLEGRGIETEYYNRTTDTRTTARNTHLNLAIGVEF